MIARTIIAVVGAGLIAVQVVRTAVVEALADANPAMASNWWPAHPAVEVSSAMTAIARAAHDRKPVPPSTFAIMADAASKAPLAVEPFLVRGVQLQVAADGSGAQRAFEAAQWRDPRSLPAAFFLADRYLRIGDNSRGLNEVATLSRLAPNGAATLAPYVAAYARIPSNWPSLRQVFRANPQLAGPALFTLASSMATVPAVLALADLPVKPGQAQWLPALMNTLLDAGEYARAREIWSRANGLRSADLVYDASFRDKAAPPPFNWSLTSSAVGLAERQTGGRLHVVFYGQEDGILASQLLLLPPGLYRLSMQLLGDPSRAKALNWSIWCDKAASPIASVGLDRTGQGWGFAIPAGCPAQWLKLSGASGDLSQQVDVNIGALKLERIAPSA